VLPIGTEVAGGGGDDEGERDESGGTLQISYPKQGVM
jgi:hypothetical protein